MQTLLVRVKSNYGNEAVYPVCEKSHLLTELLGTKTFTVEARAILKELDYTFEVVPERIFDGAEFRNRRPGCIASKLRHMGHGETAADLSPMRRYSEGV